VGLFEVPMMALRRFVLSNPLHGDSAAIRFIREQLPSGAVVQIDPFWAEGGLRMGAIPLMNRQVGVMSPDDPEVNVFRPRDVHQMHEAVRLVERAAETDSARESAELFRRIGVTHVLLGSLERRRWSHVEKFDDPAYFERLFDSPEARVYRVGLP
jgi:uncharacterized membrane protein